MKEAVQLNPGDEVSIVPDDYSDRPNVLPFPEPAVIRNLRPGNLVYISDGTVCLEVETAEENEVRTRVLNGGILSSHKGLNLPGVKIDIPVLTEDDKVALKFGIEHEVDWVGVSFVRTVEDMRYAKAYLKSIGSDARVMAKLERAEGVENLDSILQELDGIMVARGDLGVEIPMERVPIVQKEIVSKAAEQARVCCIATQMLRSMVVSPTPTRAEVSDIANAVFEGCDSVLLSDEIAVGQYPVDAVRVADLTIREAEKNPHYNEDKNLGSHDRTQAIASAAARLTKELHSKPIVVTSTGRAAVEVSRFRPDSDIIVFSHEESVLRQLAMVWGICPGGVIPPEPNIGNLVATLLRESLATGFVAESDLVTIVHGFLSGVSGTTNTIQVLDVREHLTRLEQQATPVV